MRNVNKYQAHLLSCGVDAFWITSAVNRRYCSGSTIAEGMALIAKDAAYYFTDSRYIEAAEAAMPEFQVLLVDAERTYTKRLQDAILLLDLTSIGFEEEDLTAGQYERYSAALSSQLVPMQEEISSFRQVKTEAELQRIRKAQEITDRTFTELLDIVQPGMTEKELKAELICRLYQNGSEGPSFDPIVLFGSNTSMPHGEAGECGLTDGMPFTLDFGCRFGGYCSDMTRTFAVGSASAKLHEIYEIVLLAQQTAIAATKAGVPGCEIDRAARDVIGKAGFGAYFGHGYGHGVGLEIHEAPNCSPRWKKPLPAGAVCSAEPGIYLPGEFGVRIEDLVVVRERGADNLTKSPKNFIIL